MMMELANYIRNVQDFPKPGIGFKDITTLISNAAALKESIAQLKAPFLKDKIDLVVGIEARGFIFASALAIEFGAGMVMVRKPGKLPYKTLKEEYELEYGTDSLEIHVDAIKPGQNVLIIDDLLATGGTVEATVRLVEELGGVIKGCAFVVELDFLKGREKLDKYRIESLIHYDGE
jgi:adenine phosphoribosyltransferase